MVLWVVRVVAVRVVVFACLEADAAVARANMVYTEDRVNKKEE